MVFLDVLALVDLDVFALVYIFTLIHGFIASTVFIPTFVYLFVFSGILVSTMVFSHIVGFCRGVGFCDGVWNILVMGEHLSSLVYILVFGDRRIGPVMHFLVLTGKGDVPTSWHKMPLLFTKHPLRRSARIPFGPRPLPLNRRIVILDIFQARKHL